MKLQKTPPPFFITGICSAYDFSWDSSFSFLGESHSEPEFAYILEGEVEVTENERVYRLGPGQLILHAPMEFHRIRSAEGSSPHLYISALRVEGEIPPALYEGIYTLSMEEREEFLSVYRGILDFYNNSLDPIDGAIGAFSLSAFFLRLSQQGERKERAIKSVGAAQYRTLVTKMTEAVEENLTVEEIGARCHISTSYIKALFSTYAGISPGAYYNRLRCQRIEQLLQDGLSVSEISDRMNFSSHNYLSLFFRRENGLSPTQYKKSLQKSDSAPV